MLRQKIPKSIAFNLFYILVLLRFDPPQLNKMETIRNVTNAAAGAIRGDSTNNNDQSNQSGSEPVSGQTGSTSGGEPYDAGNLGSE